MSSRFDNVPFEDFTELELESIFKKLCKDKGFIVHDSVSAVIRRRLSKRSGEETFGSHNFREGTYISNQQMAAGA